MAAEEFGERMHDDVGAEIDRLAQIGRRQRVVDDQRHVGLARDLGDRLDVGDDAARIGDRLDEDRLGLRRHRFFERGDVVGIGPRHVPAEILVGMIELVDRAAIKLLGRDEFVARHHQRVHHDHLRGMAGGDREAGGAAFERGDALFQHGAGRIADAGIDVAEGLQAEQRSGVLDVVEHERRGLIDRRRARAGGRIGLGAGVDRERRKARSAFGVGHEVVLFRMRRGHTAGAGLTAIKRAGEARRQGGIGPPDLIESFDRRYGRNHEIYCARIIVAAQSLCLRLIALRACRAPCAARLCRGSARAWRTACAN